MPDIFLEGPPTDSETGQQSSPGSAPPSPKHLPPRIVVQNPNGDVSLGEDTYRLRHETADAHRKQEAHLVASLQPGVDMGAMLWPVICVAAQQYDLDMGAKETLPTWAVLSLSSTCIMLDAATLLACAQDSPTVLLIITLAHAPLYASMYASHLSYNLWILTKVFVVIFTLRVLAIIKELDWLRSAREEQLQVPTGCFSQLGTWFLNKKTREHRQAFIEALGNHHNNAAVEQSDPSVSFEIGTIQID